MDGQATEILLVGSDDSLLRTRRWLLQSRGFPTLTLDRIEHIETIPREAEIVLAILCHSLDEEHCARAAQAIALRWPQAKCLALSSPSEHACQNKVHGLPIPVQSPSDLLSAVQTILAA